MVSSALRRAVGMLLLTAAILNVSGKSRPPLTVWLLYDIITRESVKRVGVLDTFLLLCYLNNEEVWVWVCVCVYPHVCLFFYLYLLVE